MQRLNWMTPLALLVVLAACGGEAAEDAETDGMMAEDTTLLDEGMVMGSDLACAPTATGAELSSRSSPYDSVDIQVDDVEARICYSRPSLRGRTMIGGDAVPFDTIWRTGANEPTIINLDGPARIADIDVETGSYSLYTIPREDSDWTLIVNSSTSQWGHESRYTDEVRSNEMGRAEVEAETVDEEIDQFTIRPMEEEDGTGVLIEWQNSRVRVPIQPVG